MLLDNWLPVRGTSKGFRKKLFTVFLLAFTIAVSGIRVVYTHHHEAEDIQVQTPAGWVTLAEHLGEDHGSMPTDQTHAHETGMFSHGPGLTTGLTDSVTVAPTPAFFEQPLIGLPEARPESLLRPPTC